MKDTISVCSCLTGIWVNTWRFENMTLFQQCHNKQMLWANNTKKNYVVQGLNNCYQTT